MVNSASGEWSPFQDPRWTETLIDGPDGHGYRLAIAAPGSPAPSEGYPFILVLDGAQHFAATAGAAAALSRRPDKTGITPLAVVGLFWTSGRDGWDPGARFRDFTYTPAPPGEDPGKPYGAADAFLTTLEHRVLPAARANLPLASDHGTLFGHSLAGLFTIETRRRRPDLFKRWIAISPSLWWRPDLRPAPGPDLLVGCGALETSRDMRARAEQWNDADRGIRALVAPDADHGSAPFALLPQILRHASR